MPAPTCSIRRWIEALVKFLSRAFTALNLLLVDGGDGMGEQTQLSAQSHELAAGPPDAGPSSFLKSAMVLKSGVRRPVSHISSNCDGSPFQPAGSTRSG